MKNMSSKLLLSAAIAAATPAAFAESNSIAEAFQNGKTSLSFRLRFEEVDNKGTPEVDATTLKSRITYSTDTFNGFGATLEIDDVTAIGRTDSEFLPTILDPEDTDVNQAFISYKGGDTLVKLGRQRILLDNQRFVGGVGFRQNEQTFDAISITNKSLPDTTVFYAYIDQRNAINTSDAEHESHLFNVKYAGLPIGTISGYYYGLEQEGNGGFTGAGAGITGGSFDLDTYGIRLAGAQDVGAAKILYTAEYASQENNVANTDPDYYLIEGGVKAGGVTAKLGYEVLESDGGTGFATPLATLHKFQGWADQFLATPGTGIEDLYLTVGGKVGGVKLLAVYHDYEAESTSQDLGEEFGFLVAKQFTKNYGLSLKYTDYDAGSSGRTDRDRLWVTATAKF